jgi:hypothetical protein
MIFLTFRPWHLRLAAAGLVLALLGLVWCGGWRSGRAVMVSDQAAAAAVAALEAQGASRGEVTKPKIPDTPAGAVPIFRMTGSGEFGIDRGRQSATYSEGSTAAGPIPGTPAPSGTPGEGRQSPAVAEPAAGAPAWPAEEDLACDVDCRAWWIAGEPWGNALWTAKLQAPAGGVLFERSGTSPDSRLELSPRFVPEKWRLQFLAGGAVGLERWGVESGFLWSKGRRGWLAMIEYDPPVGTAPRDFRIHGAWVFVIR